MISFPKRHSASLGPTTIVTGAPRRCHGLTLLETVLAISLLTTFLGMLFWFYDSSLQSSDQGTKRSRDVQLARVIMNGIAESIRHAAGNISGYGPGLVGHKHGISVNTLVLPDKIVSRRRTVADEQIAAQFDLQEVSYYIAWDEENPDEDGNSRALGLAQKVSKTFNRGVFVESDTEEDVADEEAKAIKEELYAPEIKFLEFRYFDGATWWEDWQITQGNSLPMMVRITVGFTPLPPEEEEQLDLVEDNFLRNESERDPLEDDKFTMFVRLVQADVNPLGVRLQREASAFTESEEGM